jgi:hypothetical protein
MAFIAPTRQRLAPAAIAEDSHPILEAIITDTQTAALLTAVITSITNILRNPGAPKSQAAFQMYLPKDISTVSNLRRWSSEAGLSVHGLAAMSAFFADLDPARRQLAQYFTDVNSIGADRAVAINQFTLARTWRGVCQSAIAAIKHLASETDDLLPELYALNTGILVRLLQAAAAAKHLASTAMANRTFRR